MPDIMISEELYESWKKFVTRFNAEMAKHLIASSPIYAGKAAKIPWSGWWWPWLDSSTHNIYDPGGPLEKYDNYVKAKTGVSPNTVNIEKQTHYTKDLQNSWWGHCNGWSAAAVLEPEPTKMKMKLGIQFGIGDQKGLMSEAHFDDPVDLGETIENKAHKFHKLLLDWVGIGKTSVIMDVKLGKEVWNYPVAQYQMAYIQDATDPGKTHVTCTIWFADDAVNPDYVGTKSWYSNYGRDYNYWLSGSLDDPIDGEWEKGSEFDHPHTIWHPVWNPPGSHGAFGLGKPIHLIDILS